MAYRGTRVDQLIAEGSGRVRIRDGAALDGRGLTVPVPIAEIARRCAEYLGRPQDDPTVMAETMRHYQRVSAGHGIARSRARPGGLVTYTARDHPRRLRYEADAGARVLAHLAERPRAVAAEFSAAALLGVTDFSDSADTALLGPYTRRLTRDVLVPSVRRRAPGLPTWTLRLGERELAVTPPMLTLAHCLRAVLAGEHAWRTPPGLSEPPDVQAVQVIDRFRREFGLTAEHIGEALHGVIGQRTLHRLLVLSDGGADSPPETVLRLIARRAAPHLEWRSQVPVYEDGTVGAPGSLDGRRSVLTVLDLAVVGSRLYLYYDGEHHLERARRDVDSRIAAELTTRGWAGLRVTAGMLDDVRSLNVHIRPLGNPELRAA